ncbi:MAG: hypothetical protein KA239_06300 [Bacteroidia bacterium]|nr:hypothetical protein [Bacteroidota bacterium]MBP6721910.1 hypothetical protein [Bacteroidia bacterium]
MHVEKIFLMIGAVFGGKSHNFCTQSILLFPKSFTESGQGSSKTIPSLVSWPGSLFLPPYVQTFPEPPKIVPACLLATKIVF